MNNPYIYIAVCMIVSFICGVCLARSYYVDEIKAIRDEQEFKTLQTIRDNYAKERYKTKLLMEELGETLDIDIVELPSFGYTVLKGATSVEDQL